MLQGPTVGDRLISSIKRRSKGTKEASPAAEAHSLFGEVLREDPDHGHALKSYARFLYLVESDLAAAEQLFRQVWSTVIVLGCEQKGSAACKWMV